MGKAHVREEGGEEGQGRLLRASDKWRGFSSSCRYLYIVILERILFCPCGVPVVGPRAGVVLAAVAGTEVRTGALLALHWDSSGQARAQPSLFIALTRRGQAASKKLIAPQTSWRGEG